MNWMYLPGLRPICLLALCCLSIAADAADETRTYTCDNGSRLAIAYATDADGRPQATLQFADDAVVLPQVPSASGTLYRQGDIRLHTREDEAILEDGHHNVRRCREGDIGPSTAAATPAAPGSFVTLAGTVSYQGQIALPPEAQLTLRIVDRANGKRPLVLVEQRYILTDAPTSIPFSATLDRSLIGKRSRLVVTARIDAGRKLHLTGERSYPLTDPLLAIDVPVRPSRPLSAKR